MNVSDNTILAFKAICSFVTDLGEVFDKVKSILLYKRLISKTQINHTSSIEKHVSVFTEFCVKNREAIQVQDEKKISGKIEFTPEKIYLDFDFIFSKADTETRSAIFQHLLTISAIVDPLGNAKEILKKNSEAGGNIEANNLLGNIIDKVKTSVNPNASPQEAMSSIMSSGVMGELMNTMQSGMSSGKLDIGQLLGAVQGMVQSLSAEAGDDPESKQAMGMINNMSGMLQNASSGNAPPPDMMAMMATMLPTMLSSFGAGGGSLPGNLPTNLPTVPEENNQEKK